MFSAPFNKIVDSIGDAADKIFTSDEERLAFEAKMLEIKATANLEMKKLAVEVDKQVTERHANDMKSDSWLSKNVRPLVLIITMATIYTLVYLTVFTALTELQVGVLESWIPVLVGVFSVMVTFYFGSRGFEKVQKIKQDKNTNE